MSNFDEIRKIMIEVGKEFLNSLEEELSEDNCECEEECCCYDFEDEYDDCLFRFSNPKNNFVERYDKKRFITLIHDIGRRGYQSSSPETMLNPEPIFESVQDRLHKFYDSPYFIVREQDNCIAIAAPIFLKDAKNKIAQTLSIIPECFIEVSGPQSMVLIIDCEKEWLRSKYLGIGEEEWLL